MTGCTPTGGAHLRVLAEALDGFAAEAETVERWGRQLADVLVSGGRLLALGNGGSAAQAQHLTAELVGRYRDDRSPYSAIALHAETSTLTALLNDYPVEEVFARQVEAHGRPGDVLVAMSTSGRSPNVIAAVRRARAAGLTTWAFTGPRPNPLAAEADEALAVEAPFTATVQELHLVGLHMLCAAFDAALGVIDLEADRIELPAPPLTPAATA
ncbi:D-sedoheptulose-7-phosphate isomerase [Motilibacter deserti]|uniref:SIS domain-containing protein n=1 Tax=Motilibacter deserti TaxID=2714956 RepID=A0ABX0GTC5_9ACTN|nr:SIS domain-containing protein [Motilibacter deserti]NHC14149.1 SIS domain-containing protein [Motilibacter deserti]